MLGTRNSVLNSSIIYCSESYLISKDEVEKRVSQELQSCLVNLGLLLTVALGV